jgi:hypothetical protein
MSQLAFIAFSLNGIDAQKFYKVRSLFTLNAWLKTKAVTLQFVI